ncbi:MAG: hypothetical protein LBE18_07460, partial [Planctomycetaceae bacterium]|nr:hypothetical protein [Planctomycetaceae bacterium]
ATGITFEQVWLLIQENAKQAEKEFKELRALIKQTDDQIKQTNEQIKLNDKQVKEQIKQTDEQIKQTNEQIKQTSEQIKQTDKQVRDQIKQTNKQVGELSNRFGEMTECLVSPEIDKEFNKFNYHFKQASCNTNIKNENDQVIAELDVLLEDDNFILCIEVKVKPDEKDIQQHINRLKIAHKHFKQIRQGEKKIVGAIAAMVFTKKIKRLVIENGLYAITPSGKTFKVDVPDGFQPKHFVSVEE